jgi:hypothetical protein
LNNKETKTQRPDYKTIQLLPPVKAFDQRVKALLTRFFITDFLFVAWLLGCSISTRKAGEEKEIHAPVSKRAHPAPGSTGIDDRPYKKRDEPYKVASQILPVLAKTTG